MKKQEGLQKKKEKVRNSKPTMENDSLQYNAQDLDQEQTVDVNPVQLNNQNIHVTVSNNITDYSGKIIGSAFIARNKAIAANASIYLFFGNESKNPVCKTNTDNNGNFIIEDLPPGYYSLFAKYGELLKFEAYSIKVLPCQKVNQSILLKQSF